MRKDGVSYGDLPKQGTPYILEILREPPKTSTLNSDLRTLLGEMSIWAQAFCELQRIIYSLLENLPQMEIFLGV